MMHAAAAHALERWHDAARAARAAREEEERRRDVARLIVGPRPGRTCARVRRLQSFVVGLVNLVCNVA